MGCVMRDGIRDARSNVHAAGYFDTLTVDPTGVFGTEECYHSTDVFGNAGPAQSGDTGYGLLNFLTVTKTAAAKVGHDSAGGNYVGANPS